MSFGTTNPLDRTARLAGGLHLSLIPLGFFSFVYVPARLFAGADATTIFRKISESEALFRWGIVSHLLSQIVVVFLLLALFRLLRSVKRDRALLMLVLGLICVPVSFLSEVNALAALDAIRESTGGALAAEPVGARVASLLDMHRSGVLLAQVFWALWMLPLAALAWRSGFIPKALSIPVLIAATGYLVDSGAHLLGWDVPAVSPFTAVGELPLPLWLLIKGLSRDHREAR